MDLSDNTRYFSMGKKPNLQKDKQDVKETDNKKFEPTWSWCDPGTEYLCMFPGDKVIDDLVFLFSCCYESGLQEAECFFDLTPQHSCAISRIW